MSKKSSEIRPEPEPATKAAAIDGREGPSGSGLLANISHELRTPMNAILGYLDLLTDTTLNDTQQTFVSAIERAAKGLLDIMDDALNLSRMEAGKLIIHKQPFSIRDCLDSVAQILAPTAYRKGLEFIRIIDQAVPVNFIGDPLHIRQILVNLVGNAIKFTTTGQVRLTVTAHCIDDRRYELVMRVTDTGIGIKPADLPKIFVPFSQPARPGGDIAGTGLGLAISKALCETMGGNIAVNSTAGEGSTFCARIPIESMDKSFQTDEGSGLLDRRTIVVVCADTDLAGWIADNVRQEGAMTRHVADFKTLAGEASLDEQSDDIVVAFIGARDLAELDRLELDWQPVRGKLPVLSLVSSVAGHTLQRVADVLGGDAIPAHSPAATINRRIETLLQKHTASPHRRARPPSAVAQLLAGLHLLVAEDNQFGRDYLQMLLSRHGASVDVCHDGREVCRMMAARRYDLVLMDVRMPHCDGIEAMKELTQSGQTLPPIVGLTAAPEEFSRALAAGMTDCLLKPVRPAALLQYIGSHVSKSLPRQAGPLSFIDNEMRDELNNELPRRATQLLAAITNGDMAIALDAAHKLNGTAALCGFAQLHATAASIEGLIRQQQLDGIERLTRNLNAQVDEALASLITS